MSKKAEDGGLQCSHPDIAQKCLTCERKAKFCKKCQTEYILPHKRS